MEATSLYLVALELMLAFWGGILFLYGRLLKGGALSKTEISVALLTIASSLWFTLAATEGRWLGFKTSLFVGCLYLASKFPRQGVLLMVGVVLMHFLLGATAGEIDTHYFVFPFSLIACGVVLLRRTNRTNVALFYVAASLEVALALSVGARGIVVSALLAILLVLSVRASRIFLKYGQWIPLFYLGLMVIGYYFLIAGVDWIPKSASNFERTSMISAAVALFLKYPITGPREGFDAFVGAAMDAFNQQPYDSAKGVDPHSFLLSLWRDEGAILTVLWFFVWLYYWHQLKELRFRLREKRVRIALAMLAFAVVQFSLSPPDTGTRLMVALTLGAVLGFANRRASVSVNYLHKQRCRDEGTIDPLMDGHTNLK